MLALKLRKVGTSTGVVLPKEMLRHLHAKEGQEIYAVETLNGYLLTTLDPRAQKQVEMGEAFMDRYRDVFAVLAKCTEPVWVEKEALLLLHAKGLARFGGKRMKV